VRWYAFSGDSGNQQKEYLTLGQHLAVRAKRRGTSAQARLLAWLFTTPLIFPRSRVMRSAKHV